MRLTPIKRELWILLTAFVLLSLQGMSQENIRVMHYNLLFYGKFIYDCNESTNGIEDKTSHLKTIIDHTRPDVFTVNELDGEGAVPEQDDATYLLNGALNAGGRTYYRKAPFEESFSVNTLFYNSNKLTLYNHHTIPLEGDDKIFNGYTFYYNSSELATSSDTTFFTCFVVHLKAGSDLSDQQLRVQEAQQLMNYIDSEMPEGSNYLLAGDLNVYTAAEDAYQELMDPPDNARRLFDPVGQPGDWHDNADFKHYHTQSTHSSGDCFSGGGMDDRFDFILLSESILNGIGEVSYIDGTYETIGQDGSYFNQSLNFTSNSSVPEEVARALYGCSDHLPVQLQLRLSGDPAVELAVDTVFYQPAEPSKDDSVEVFAQVSDTEGQVSQVRTLWGTDSEQYSRDTAMVLDGNYYTTKLPPNDAGQNVYFRVRGFDSEEQVIVSSAEHQYRVDEASDLEGPEGKPSPEYRIVHPVKNQLIVLAEENMRGQYLVEIGDMSGRTYISQSMQLYGSKRLSLPVGSLEPGIYWLRIRDDRGQRMYKFIKQ